MSNLEKDTSFEQNSSEVYATTNRPEEIASLYFDDESIPKTVIDIFYSLTPLESIYDEISSMDEIKVANHINDEDIENGKKALSLAEQAVATSELNLSRLKEHSYELNMMSSSILKTITELTKNDGNDKKLSSRLKELSKLEITQPKQVFETVIRRYLAAKLFDRGDVDNAVEVLNDKDFFSDTIDIILFMHLGNEKNTAGIESPFIVIEKSKQIISATAGRIEEFKMIGAPESIQEIDEQLRNKNFAEKLPLNSCLIKGTNKNGEDIDIHFLKTDDIVIDKEESANLPDEILNNSNDHYSKVIVGRDNINAFINSLNSSYIPESEFERGLSIFDSQITGIALALKNAGYSVGNSKIVNDFALPEDHIQRSLNVYVGKTVSNIVSMLINDDSFYISNFGSDDKLTYKVNNSVFGLKTSYTRNPQQINLLVRKVMDNYAGDGYENIYGRNRHSPTELLSAICKRVRNKLISDEIKMWSNDHERIDQIANYFGKYIAELEINTKRQ